MATLTIQYNPSNTLVQPVIELIRRMKSIKILEDSTEYVPNKETLSAMKEARDGNTNHYDSVDEMFTKILGKSYV